MRIIEGTAVWVDDDYMVNWEIPRKMLQDLNGDVKITITEQEKGGVEEFTLPRSRCGSFEHDFEDGKHYSIHLLLGEQECALATI